MNDEDRQPRGPLRVAILSDAPHQQPHLIKTLKDNGLNVVARYSISHQALDHISPSNADVILVNLDEHAESDMDVLDSILEDAQLPVLFNDSAGSAFTGSNADWGKRLATKLWSLAKRQPPTPKPKPKPKMDPPKPLPFKTPTFENVARSPLNPHQEGTCAENVWILAASLGGPLAVREFLSKIPHDLPAGFILVQHIGASHLDLLAEQLDRVTPFKVATAKPGHLLKHQEVVLAPVHERMLIDEGGRIQLKPHTEDCIYSPCIDIVMADMGRRYGKKLGTIVFSGMGNDGEKGCYAVAHTGGTIWAQDAESCIISSMPDNARKTGHVSFTETSEGLARQLIKLLMNATH